MKPSPRTDASARGGVGKPPRRLARNRTKRFCTREDYSLINIISLNPNTPPNPRLPLRPIIFEIFSSKSLWEKLRRKHTICHEKLLLKPSGKNKEKMTYIVHACIDIASLKTCREKPCGKLTKGKSAIS